MINGKSDKVFTFYKILIFNSYSYCLNLLLRKGFLNVNFYSMGIYTCKSFWI